MQVEVNRRENAAANAGGRPPGSARLGLHGLLQSIQDVGALPPGRAVSLTRSRRKCRRLAGLEARGRPLLDAEGVVAHVDLGMGGEVPAGAPSRPETGKNSGEVEVGVQAGRPKEKSRGCWPRKSLKASAGFRTAEVHADAIIPARAPGRSWRVARKASTLAYHRRFADRAASKATECGGSQVSWNTSEIGRCAGHSGEAESAQVQKSVRCPLGHFVHEIIDGDEDLEEFGGGIGSACRPLPAA